MAAIRPLRPALFFALLLVAGCGPGKLNEAVNWSIPDTVPAQGLELPAQSKPQKITVEFTSTADASVYVFKKEDAKTVDDLVYADTKKALGGVKDSKGSTFTAEIPANTPVWVAVRTGMRKMDVKLSVTNQK